jgi:6-phosphogluconate dehydrogenase (decarboxylating)
MQLGLVGLGRMGANMRDRLRAAGIEVFRVRSWLLELLVAALDQDPELVQLRGWVQDSGEGRWTVEEAINHAVPAPVISASPTHRRCARSQRCASSSAATPCSKLVPTDVCPPA